MPSINLCPQTVIVQSPTVSRDSSGGEVQTWANAYNAVPCNIQPISTKWQIMYQSRLITASHTLYFTKSPVQLTIKNGYRILYGSRTFQVQGVRNPLEMNRQLVVDVLELL